MALLRILLNYFYKVIREDFIISSNRSIYKYFIIISIK